MRQDGLTHCRICGAPAKKALGVPFRLVCKACQEVLDLERQERVLYVRQMLTGNTVDKPTPNYGDET